MSLEVKVPSVGESITSGLLGVWNKSDGAEVKAGDVLFEIETDKVTSEVTAETAGVLKHLVKVGETVQIGQVVARIEESSSAATAPKSSEAAPKASETVSAEASATGRNGATAPASTIAATKLEVSNGSPASPVAPNRGTHADALSPAVRYHLEEQNLDPKEIQGSGKDGRILKGDVLAQAARPAAPSASPPEASRPVEPVQMPAPMTERTSRRKMSPLRQKIAARLLSAQHETAHLTTFNEVDFSNIMALRGRYQDRFVKKYEVKLGFMSFFVRAVIHALQTVPAMNSRLEGDEIIQNHFFDIGVAISTDKGLLVPVLRGADKLSFAEIEKAIATYAKKARDGKITLPDLEGGVFTITNGGVFGSLLSTPILNPPQCGILGMHTIQERPVAINGRVEIRPMMYLALTYDHRLVDGKEAVTFLATVKDIAENPAGVLFEL